MSELGADQDDSEQDESKLVLPDEEDRADGGLDHHTLKLSRSIAVASEIMCLAFSEDGRFLLACCGDGIVRVFNPKTGVLISLLVSKRDSARGDGEADGAGDNERGRRAKRASSILDNVQLPCTCAAFRPNVKVREKTSGVAVIGYSHGGFQLWHVPSAKLLHRQTVSATSEHPNSWEEAKEVHARGSVGPEEKNSYLEPVGLEILCCAYAGDGNSFAVGASDGAVRIYSDDTKELVVELMPGVGRGSGHSSRIFSVKFHPDDNNVLVSGGWDNCVHVWDIGKATTIRTVFGPHICGDAVDVMGKTILTGSWRDDSQLQTWDIDNGEPIGPSFWAGHGKGPMLQMGAGRRCRLYAAAFGGPERSLGRFIAAGGGEGANEVKVFDFLNDNRLVGSLLGLSAGAISLAFGEGGTRLAAGLADGQIHLVDIEATSVAPTTSNGNTIMAF